MTRKYQYVLFIAQKADTHTNFTWVNRVILRVTSFFFVVVVVVVIIIIIIITIIIEWMNEERKAQT